VWESINLLPSVVTVPGIIDEVSKDVDVTDTSLGTRFREKLLQH
jgi:hypothetical protein